VSVIRYLLVKQMLGIEDDPVSQPSWLGVRDARPDVPAV